MEIGKRLKEARLAAGLSQRQLCADTITRNMLSQIENGTAKPSMDTLQVLAKRLGKPVGFFLDGGNDPMEQVRECFRQEDYSGALKALENLQNESDESRLLRGICRLQLAEEAVKQGRTPYAISLLEECTADFENCPYCLPVLERRRLILLAKVLPDETEQILKNLPPEDEELLLRAQVALHQQESQLAISLLESVQLRQGSRWFMLRGRAAFQLEDYSAAVDFFKQAELAGETNAYGWLEQSYRLLEDYKMAYYYACKQK